MKKLLFSLLLLCMAVAFLSPHAKASHAQGSDLTYVNVGPNQYLVTFKFYRDCSGISAPTTMPIQYRAPGCDTGAMVNLQRTAGSVGNLYCPQVTPNCNGSSSFPNYEEYLYSGLITLPSNCANWNLSVQITARNESRNLVNGSGQWLYSEAMLNNQDFQANSSPSFTNLPVPYVGVNLNYTYSLGTIEPDGDSLAFSLQPALNDLNTPVNYAPGYSASNPLGPNANPGVTVDSLTGNMQFRPIVYDSTSSPVAGMNKYVWVVQVDEFRKDTINNVFKKIGHVRRDVLVTVIDCGPNQLPTLMPMMVNGSAANYNSVIEIEAGQTTTFQLNASDPNLVNQLNLSSNFDRYFSGGSFITTGSPAYPSGTLTINPTLSEVRDYPYYITFTVKDDACPIVGFETQIIGLRVKSPGSVSGIKKDLAKKYQLPTLLNTNLNGRLQLHPELNGATVKIYNHTGSLVKSISNYNNSWNANSVAAGLYIYSVEHTGLAQPITSKLLVVK